MKIPELLAPAGSMESLQAAVRGGADAVYMGGRKFGARAYADNPDDDRICEAIDYAHLHGVKLYMTVNTLMKERELGEELLPFLKRPYEAGVDAVLVQDLGVLTMIRKHYPDLPVHISTQMTLASAYGAKTAKRLGAERVVLPRELSLPEIVKIREESGLEVETFIHGALCYCYSGQCLMSSMIGGRSGNRGRCAQPCRLPYRTAAKPEHILNLKDICSLQILPELAAAGIASLKIEGRMKSPVYTLGTTAVYRKYLDRIRDEKPYAVDPEDVRFLLELFDRGGYSEGYYHRHNGPSMIFKGEKPAKRIVDEELLKKHFEEIESYAGNEEDSKCIDTNTNGGKHSSANIERSSRSSNVNIKGTLTIVPGKCATISMTCRGRQTVFQGPEVMEALHRPMTEEEIRTRMMKTGDTGFVFSDLDIRISGSPFIPVGELNRFRRGAVEAVREDILNEYRRKS